MREAMRSAYADAMPEPCVAPMLRTDGRTDLRRTSLTLGRNLSLANARDERTEINLEGETMSSESADRLAPATTGYGLSTGRHRDLDEFDRALAEYEASCKCVCPGCRDREHCAGVYCDQTTA